MNFNIHNIILKKRQHDKDNENGPTIRRFLDWIFLLWNLDQMGILVVLQKIWKGYDGYVLDLI